MKKILKLALATSVAFSFSALATTATGPTEVTLTGGYQDIVATGAAKNVSQNITLKPIAQRAGFVKNEFQITTSANVALGVNDDNTEGFKGQRFGVVAGANRGRAVFTGTSEGGSVTQCGEIVAKTVANGGASEVKTATLVFANENGCKDSPALAAAP